MIFAARLQQADTAASKRRARSAAKITRSWLPKFILRGFTPDGRANPDFQLLDLFDWMRADRSCPGMSSEQWAHELFTGIRHVDQSAKLASVINLITLLISQLLELRRPAPPPTLHSAGRPILAAISVRLSTPPLPHA